LTVPKDHAGVRDDLHVTECDALGPGGVCAHASEQRPHAGGEFLRRKWLGEVVVGARLETCNDVMRIGTGGHDDDRDIARLSERATELESTHARQHEIDEREVDRSA
jgi:hypothetical protein